MAYGGWSSDNYLTLPDGLVTALASPITVEFWALLPDLTVDSAIAFVLGDPAAGAVQHALAYLATSGELNWDYGDPTSGGRVGHSFSGHVGYWTHICLTADDSIGQLSIVLNGWTVASHAWTPGSDSFNGGSLGFWPGSGVAASDATLCHFAVYNRVLTGDETSAHASAASESAYVTAVLAATPEIYLELDSAPTDSSGNGLDATVVGAPTAGLPGPWIPTISPAGIDSAEAFGIPDLSGGAPIISPLGIPSAEAFGTPECIPPQPTVQIFPAPWDAVEDFGVPELSASDVSYIYPVGIS